MNNKKILLSWFDLLSLFRPHELLQLAFFEWKGAQELVSFFMRYLWWAYMLWVGIWGIRVFTLYMPVKYFAGNFPLTLLLSMIFMAFDPFMYFFFIGGLRPSLERKGYDYFKLLSFHFLNFFLLILAIHALVFSILHVCALVHPQIHTFMSFIISWVLLLKLPEGGILLSPMVMIVAFFFLDSISVAISLRDYVKIFKKSVLFLLYNYPLYLFCALITYGISSFFQPYLSAFYTDLLFPVAQPSGMLLLVYSISFLYVLLLPLYLILMNNLYLKRVFKNIDCYE